MTPPASPPLDCALCPRLAAFHSANRIAFPGFHNARVASFGAAGAPLLVVGLAPGLKGANQTGRPFTGDYAGDLLYPTLIKFGFARGTFDRRPDDGLELVGCRVTNAVRCVPPQNKPTTQEIRTCGSYLKSEIEGMSELRAVLALGGIAHGAVLSALGHRKSARKFAHGAMHDLPGGPMLADSYHCSRYNTNTRRLTTEMFESVFAELRRYLG